MGRRSQQVNVARTRIDPRPWQNDIPLHVISASGCKMLHAARHICLIETSRVTRFYDTAPPKTELNYQDFGHM